MIRNPGVRNIILFFLICCLYGCRDGAVPKPRGYFRIDLPVKEYRLYDTICPFIFEYPVYGHISYDVGKNSEPCWFNLEFLKNKAIIHFSYKPVNKNLEAILKESHDYAYSHSIKADAITELPWQNNENKVYGILYDIIGNTASSIQFFLTDSTKNFFRGALYFSAEPEADSLAPVIRFFREDIIHMIETFKWKNQ
ncbi:MAG: gliding motility lipoprotein GldD [Odoribacter sp.]|nr:gliding motility lipoprotein GldD [Odoribacter sp.]